MDVDELFPDAKNGTIRRSCSKYSETEACSTISLIPGIGLGEDTVCYCSTDLCNSAATLSVTTLICVRTYVILVLIVVVQFHLDVR